MCGCSRGTTSGAASGAWQTASTPSLAQPDGPWEVQRPVYRVDDQGVLVRDGWETLIVDTYSEADSLVREVDPATGKARGGGIRRRLDLKLAGAGSTG